MISKVFVSLKAVAGTNTAKHIEWCNRCSGKCSRGCKVVDYVSLVVKKLLATAGNHPNELKSDGNRSICDSQSQVFSRKRST